MEEEIHTLNEKLKKLRVKEHTIVQRLRTLGHSPSISSSPTSYTTTNRSGATVTFHIGDIVSFGPTTTTTGGTGHIINFTAGTSPFATIQRSGTRGANFPVRRKPKNITHSHPRIPS
jgi:hypothetical protein